MSDGDEEEIRIFANKKDFDMDGYVQKQFEGRTKRYVHTLDLRNDPNLIREYRKWHSEAHHWREIREGIRAVNQKKMRMKVKKHHLKRMKLPMRTYHPTNNEESKEGKKESLSVAIQISFPLFFALYFKLSHPFFPFSTNIKKWAFRTIWISRFTVVPSKKD